MTDAGLIRNQITDDGIQMMRDRVGYPNPTVRSGTRQLSWWTTTTSDAIRHHVNGYGDDNPLYIDPDYARATRWGGQIAPPGFVAAGGPNAHRTPVPLPPGDDLVVEKGAEEEAWFRRLGRGMPNGFDARTRSALRGIQLYSSGVDTHFYRPLYLGDWNAGTAGGVHGVEDKVSEFAGRSAIVANRQFSWNQRGEITTIGRSWFVHAERKKSKSDDSTRRKEERARYTDEQLAEIEAAYDAERHRGADTLWYEDVAIGDQMPGMVKGPLVLTDMFNQHMGSGWFGYGNPPLRLGYENRKKMRGFYTRNIYNSWDVIQRVHWDEALAQEVGVPLMYDIAPMRNAWVLHYCTNFMGDDAWLFHIHTELRKFNYFGDTTWYTGMVIDKLIHPDAGPAIVVKISGMNQRGDENTTATATVLLASREHGAVKLPEPPADLAEKATQLRWERNLARAEADG
jgi:hypothetical protein